MNSPSKSLHIPSDYFSYGYIQQINQIVKPLFTLSPITYFDFSRIYLDKSFSFLVSQSGINEFLFEHGFTFLPHIDIKQHATFTLLSSLPYCAPYVAQVKEHFNLDYLFSFTKTEKNYLDICLVQMLITIKQLSFTLITLI